MLTIIIIKKKKDMIMLTLKKIKRIVVELQMNQINQKRESIYNFSVMAPSFNQSLSNKLF